MACEVFGIERERRIGSASPLVPVLFTWQRTEALWNRMAKGIVGANPKIPPVVVHGVALRAPAVFKLHEPGVVQVRSPQVQVGITVSRVRIDGGPHDEIVGPGFEMLGIGRPEFV